MSAFLDTLGGFAGAILRIRRLNRRPGRGLRQAAREYDERVAFAQRRLTEAERKWGPYDERTVTAKIELETARADTTAVDHAWSESDRAPEG